MTIDCCFGNLLQLACCMDNLLNKQMLTFTTPASIKNGDHAAFLAAYNELHIKVFRFFLKKVFTEDDAKDLTQQCFIRLWQFRHTLSEEHVLDKQVFVIAHSMLVNHFEKEAHQKKIKTLHLQIEKGAVNESNEHDSFELSDHVNAAIDMLPPVRKKILILKAFHDYSNKEIAQQMEISVKTVEDHVTKAFRRMKEVMLLIFIPLMHLVLNR